MKQDTITVERVLALIEAYGAEPGAWPDAERDAASALLEARPDQFAAALAEARALDRLIERETVPEPSTGLAQRILADAPGPAPERHTSTRRMGWLIPRGFRWPAGAIASSLLVGIVSGYAYAGAMVTSLNTSADDAYESAFGYSVLNDWTEMEIGE